jgi:hypothetical protein
MRKLGNEADLLYLTNSSKKWRYGPCQDRLQAAYVPSGLFLREQCVRGVKPSTRFHCAVHMQRLTLYQLQRLFSIELADMSIVVFWAVKQCGLLGGYQRSSKTSRPRKPHSTFSLPWEP